jgi:hypothetical protein
VPELGRAVDVEVDARFAMDRLLDLLQLGAELAGQPPEPRRIDRDPPPFHVREHARERQLDVAQE